MSFGTLAHGRHGVVDSGHACLWAIGRSSGGDGKIVRGWVPQRAFVTHAGWNSVLESLAAVRPMLTWPVMAEQAANAKLVADIIGAGVRAVRGGGVVVGRAEVAGKVGRLMDGGEEGRAIRARAEEVREAARAAVGEGGASREALRRLVDELRSSYVVAGDGTAAASSANGGSGKC